MIKTHHRVCGVFAPSDSPSIRKLLDVTDGIISRAEKIAIDRQNDFGVAEIMKELMVAVGLIEHPLQSHSLTVVMEGLMGGPLGTRPTGDQLIEQPPDRWAGRRCQRAQPQSGSYQNR